MVRLVLSPSCVKGHRGDAGVKPGEELYSVSSPIVIRQFIFMFLKISFRLSKHREARKQKSKIKNQKSKIKNKNQKSEFVNTRSHTKLEIY
jgi:hypothetical protein